MDLTDLLDIVRNEKLYTKRIEELQNLGANAKAATERLTKAKDIDTALANAKRAEQTANDMLKEARDKYQATTSEAEANGEFLVNQARKVADSIINAVNDKKNELAGMAMQLDAVSKELDSTHRSVADAKRELASITAQSIQLREDVKRKTQQLKDLLSA